MAVITVGTNSYVLEADLVTYAADRGITLTGDTDVLLIKAMDYFESLDFQGTRTVETQALSWPRYNVYIDGVWQNSDTVPQEVKNAQMAIAVSIDQTIDPLADLAPAVKMERVGDLQVEYQDGAASASISRAIQAATRKLVRGGSSSGGFVVMRG